MQALTRRQVVTLIVGGSATCLAPFPIAQAQAKVNSPHTLAKAILVFNEQAAKETIGKTQPPLTEAEVIAAIRWINAWRTDSGVKEEEYSALFKIAETRLLPPGATLEVLTDFEPNDTVVVTAWSVCDGLNNC